jgi:hypothetical protein
MRKGGQEPHLHITSIFYGISMLFGNFLLCLLIYFSEDRKCWSEERTQSCSIKQTSFDLISLHQWSMRTLNITRDNKEPLNHFQSL